LGLIVINELWGAHSGHPWPSPFGQLALCQTAVLRPGRDSLGPSMALALRAAGAVPNGCPAVGQGFTQAIHGLRPAGSLRLCQTAILPFGRTKGFSSKPSSPPDTEKPPCGGPS